MSIKKKKTGSRAVARKRSTLDSPVKPKPKLIRVLRLRGPEEREVARALKAYRDKEDD